ncbi:MAG: hypothetical protein BGP15_14800 [Sphingobacterium sp. 40-24]|nr:MAG: hypothetical protein BGP15_14800 [Sphingobacterium sp. 40-24]
MVLFLASHLVLQFTNPLPGAYAVYRTKNTNKSLKFNLIGEALKSHKAQYSPDVNTIRSLLPRISPSYL